MKLKDFILITYGSIAGVFAKSIRTEIIENTKDDIVNKNLYHFTSKESAEKILESGYIKPSKGITAYGRDCCFMFSGLPNLDLLVTDLSTSPYLQPDMIFHAVEMKVQKEELSHYKVRPFADGAVMYEGFCVFPDDRVNKVEIVADLKRDENGNVILDPKTGKPLEIALRKRTPEEIEKSPDKYIPSQEYLDFVKEKQKENGYSTKNGKLARGYNQINMIFSSGKLELNHINTNVKKNLFSYIKQKLQNMRNKSTMIDEPEDEKISNDLLGKSFLDRKHPYRDEKFGKAVAKYKTEGLTQFNLEEILPEFVNSRSGIFLREKREQIDKAPIRKKGIHGMGHMDRVAILALMIGEKENILGENSTRERELLTYTSYYHDIGRIGDSGPHSKRSARKIKKLDLKYLDGKSFSDEDKRLVEFLVEGHEGSDKNVDDLIEKYKIEEKDRELAKKLLWIIKDSDALDRARLTVDNNLMTKTNLEPRFLRLDSSKRLLEASYGLESLTSKVSIESLLNYKNERVGEKYTKYNYQEDKLAEYKIEDYDKKLEEHQKETKTQSLDIDKEMEK